jgi:hypothetical protein
LRENLENANMTPINIENIYGKIREIKRRSA